jgi:hypothetical protein
MFSVIKNIYNKKIKGPTFMELFTATGKLKKFFWQLEMLDVCTTGDTAHIDTICKFLPHARQHGCIDDLHWCNYPCLRGHVAIVGRRFYCVCPTIATWPRWPKDIDHYNSEAYRCTHVDTCMARTWISYRCVLCHPWCTHRTTLVVKQNFFCFPVAVNNSIKVESFAFFYKCL